jgi:hypothetical protein
MKHLAAERDGLPGKRPGDDQVHQCRQFPQPAVDFRYRLPCAGRRFRHI